VFLPFGSKMVIADKSSMQMFLLMIAASTVLVAQTSGPDASQNQASVTDARQVMIPSVLATQRSWQDAQCEQEGDRDRTGGAVGAVEGAGG
jgi:hypothetical protein